MHFDHQLDVGADRLAHRLDDRNGAIALLAVHREVSDAERIPFERAETLRYGQGGLLAEFAGLARATNQPLA